MRTNVQILTAIGAALTASISLAHVTLETPTATPGQSIKAVLRIGHGCEGSATTAVRVQLPDGFRGAKPMPKAGWTISTVVEPLAKPYVEHGKTFSEGVTQVTWTARDAAAYLADSHYDEFVVRGAAPETVGAVWFKVLQSCEKGTNDWSEIPASGTSTRGMKFPAALLEVRAAGAAAAAGEHKH